MVNLIPYKKNNTSSLIKADKLISSSLIKKSAKIDSKIGSEEKTLLNIQQKVIKIDKLLKNSILLKKKGTEKKRVSTEQTEFEQREKDLEKNKPKAIPGIKLPSPPKLGIFDWIKNFIFNTLLGFVFIRLYEHLPKLLKLVPIIFKAGEFLIDIGGKLLDGLVTFIDWGYKAYDATRGFVKNTFGEGGVKQFDNLMSTLNKLSSVIILASLAAAMPGGPGGARSGGRGGVGIVGAKDIAGRSRYGASTSAARRYAQRFGRDAAIKKFGEEGVRSLGGKYGRSGLTRFGRNALVGTLGKGGAKAVLKFVKPLVNKIPIIGGLIEFGLSWALGEPIGKAAFRGIGSVLVGAIGTAIGGPIGAFLGAWAGGEAGGVLYDLFFGNKKPPQSKVAKAAGGGKPATRGGRLVSGPAKRTIKKKKTPRTLRATPSKLKPGAAVGGEKKIKELYPEPKDKNQMSPFGFLKNTYDRFSKSTGLDAPVALAIKSLMGDKPSATDYKNSAMGINNWMNQTIASGALAYAGGGEVKMESIVSGEDYSDVIAKSLQDSIAPQVDKTIQDLMRQMMLKQPIKEPDKTDPTIDIEEDVPSGLTKGQWGPLLDLIAGKESGGNYESMYPSTTLPGATKMTIAEVARRATGAVGKYQQLPQYLVGRAKAAGLNPDKDLYSAENQEKIIINVNIKGRGGEKWLKGEISDEQFMQGLSQEFASLPNAQGKFHYSGQRSSMTPEKVKASLAKVKKGGYSQQELAESQQNITTGGKFKVIEYITGDRNHPNLDVSGHGLPSNYHDHIAFATIAEKEKAKGALRAAGIQIGSELRPGDPGYHGRNLAIDVPGAQWGGSGSIGGREFSGSKKVRSILGIGQNAPRFHGGPILRTGNLFAHKGEFVIDKDSVDLFGFDFIDSINRIENKSQLIAKAPSIIQKLKAISGYTDYENPEPEIVYLPVYIEVEKPVPVPMGGGSGGVGGGIDNDMFSDFDAIG